MISVTDTLRMRRRHRRKHARSQGAPAGLGISLIASLAFVSLVIGAAFSYIDISRDLPSIAAIPMEFQTPNGAFTQSTKIYDRSGGHLLLSLENPAAGERRLIGLDGNLRQEIPQTLIDATISMQEPGFWSSTPFSVLISPGGKPGLAQQIVTSRLLWGEETGLRRELRARLLAAQLLGEYGHERVLAWYLNSTDYGRLAFGVEAAAQVYFGKTTADLNPAEAVILATIAQSPALNPHTAPEAVEEKVDEVLERMTALGYLDSGSAREIRSENISIKPPLQPPTNPAPAFLSYVLDQITAEIPLLILEQGGFKIFTSLDYELQTQANCTRDALLLRSGISNTTENRVEPENCQAARLLPSFASGDIPAGTKLRTNAIIYDPNQAQILAMVGDTSPGSNSISGTDLAPGTLVTTFIYLSGFTRGLSPATLVWDIPGIYPELDSLVNDFHGPMRLRTALANDYIIPAASILSQVGTENVRQTAERLGIPYAPDELNGGMDILTDGGTNLLDVARAFGVFANQGVLTGLLEEGETNNNIPPALIPVSILSVQDTHGGVWYGDRDIQSPPPVVSRPVITDQLAFLVTHILSDESARWQSMGHPNALEIGTSIAVKMGRTLDGRDAWTIGYTPEVVIGVWTGSDTEVKGDIGSELASDLWHALAQYTLRESPPTEWVMPPGISQVDVCGTSGFLPTPECPTTVREVFLAGTEPTERDYLYQSVQVNRQTGRLASVFTPPEYLEERVFLSVPADAQVWADQAGLPSPPEEYDILNPGISTSEDAQITSPELFSYVRGKLEIRGSAGGDGFQFYRLQAGQGLNPQQWLLIDQERSSSVNDGVLGIWDTSGLKGLYALQLLVVGEGQRVESVVTQVTIDNEPPQLTIIQPQSGQVYSEGIEEIDIHLDVSDDLGLERVDFRIDEQLLEALSQPPYQFQWQAVPGKHTLSVEARDQAGNTSQTEIDFSVQ